MTSLPKTAIGRLAKSDASAYSSKVQQPTAPRAIEWSSIKPVSSGADRIQLPCLGLGVKGSRGSAQCFVGGFARVAKSGTVSPQAICPCSVKDRGSCACCRMETGVTAQGAACSGGGDLLHHL